MNRTHLFPAALLILYLGAAIMYATQGDWRRFAYFMFAAGINLSVTV